MNQKTRLVKRHNSASSRGFLWFFTESWGSKQRLRRSNKKAARGRSMKARPTQSRKGVKGQLPLAGSRDSVPCGVWGNAPTVSRALNSKGTVNKGAGSEASLPVTLRVRRRAPKLLFPPRFCDEPIFMHLVEVNPLILARTEAKLRRAFDGVDAVAALDALQHVFLPRVVRRGVHHVHAGLVDGNRVE